MIKNSKYRGITDAFQTKVDQFMFVLSDLFYGGLNEKSKLYDNNKNVFSRQEREENSDFHRKFLDYEIRIENKLNHLVPISNKFNSLILKIEKKINKVYSDNLTEYDKLNEKIFTEPRLLEENIELSQLTSLSNFYRFILYFLITVFIIGYLIYISINPELKKIDYFMVYLGSFVIAYQLFHYIKK